MTNIYNKSPVKIIENIPIFSDTDDPYVMNYERIAIDHLDSLRVTGKSPFMTDDQIRESNSDTLNVLRKHLALNSRILDAGVGYGLLLKEAIDYERYGVDIAIPYLKIAQSNGISVSMSKLEDLPFNDHSFDAVVTCDVLEHVFGLDKVLSEIIRVVRNDGLLIVRVPNEEQLDGYLSNAQPYEHSHVRGFNLASLRLLFEKCLGLELIDHKYTGHFFGISSQLKYPCVSAKAAIHEEINNILDRDPSLVKNQYIRSIKKLLDITTEEMVDAMIGLRDDEPVLYESLAMHLIKPTEIIVVFRVKAG